MTGSGARSSRPALVSRAGEPRGPAVQDSAAQPQAGRRALFHLLPELLARLVPCPACEERPSSLVGVCSACHAVLLGTIGSAPPQVLDDGVFLGPYAGVWLRLVHALKYRGARVLATLLGRLLATRVAAAGLAPSIVVHVPTSAQRRRQRGYDQAELLAREVAAGLGLPHLSALSRLRHTHKLAGMGRSARGAELGGAFRSRYVAGAQVLLVDDVLTTGATLSAARGALEAAGAARVMSAVVARTAPHGQSGGGGLAHPGAGSPKQSSPAAEPCSRRR